MEQKNFVSVRLTPSSLMTLDGTIANMCHDTRATRPGYQRTDEDAVCYWSYGDYDSYPDMHTDPPSKDEVASYLTGLKNEMIKQYENTPRGKNGHKQRAKVNSRWFIEGIVTFSKEQLDKVDKITVWEHSKKFLLALSEKLKTKIAWAAVHDDETTMHIQFGLKNLDSEGHTVQRRINQRINAGVRNHLMTPQQLQDMAGEYYAPLGFRRGISRDITGAIHKSVRDMHRSEQVKMENEASVNKSRILSQNKVISEIEQEQESSGKNLLELQDLQKAVADRIEKLKEEGRSIRRSNDEIRIQTSRERDRITAVQSEIRAERKKLQNEKIKIEDEILKIQAAAESETLLRTAALIELEKREQISSKEIRLSAEDQKIKGLYRFLNTISSHSGGLFALQKEGRGYYSGSHYWSAPEIISVSDFIRDYRAMKEQNILGDQYHIRMVGTPAIFCLDDINKESISRMRDYGITPFAAIETSPGNYQVWIKFDHEGILPADKWHAVNTFLVEKFDADSGADAKNHAFRCPGFKSYKNEREGYLVRFDPELMDSNVDLKSFVDVWDDIPAFTKETSIRKTAQRSSITLEEFFGETETPDWFEEKWHDRRADLISSKHCPKRKDGKPDDSAMDYIVTKGLLQPYLRKRPEVLQQRLSFCYNMIIKEAGNPKRLHRKNKPQNYALITLNSVIRDLGIKNDMAIHKSADMDL